MDKYNFWIFYCAVLFWNVGTALKCRTGNQDDNEQYYRIMENCRKRYAVPDNDRNSGSSNSDESTDSNEDMFDRRFMSNGRFNGAGDNYNNRNGMNGYRNNQNHRPNWNRSPSTNYFNRNTSSRMYGRDGGDNDNQRYRMNRRYMNSNNWRLYNDGSNYDQRYNDDQRYNYDSQQDQSCVTQCFFNELNLVDQKGYPDRTAVNEIMLEDIQDPELRDFIEEAIIQCFHYLNLDGKQNKCQYSQNLLSCLTEKGQERCEDWNSRYK